MNKIEVMLIFAIYFIVVLLTSFQCSLDLLNMCFFLIFVDSIICPNLNKEADMSVCKKFNDAIFLFKREKRELSMT